MRRPAPLIREHWALAAVLGAGLLARVIVAIAYRPALFFSDSWAYVSLAYGGQHFAPDRPSGYPIVLHLIGLVGRNLAAVTTLQHLAGLLTGVLVYALVLRAGAGRALATVAAALVVLQGYAMVLEQTIVAEPFFTLAIVASFYLVSASKPSTLALGGAGVLLAAAVTMRSAGMFVVPAWLVFVLYRYRARGLVAVAAVVAPLLVYAAVYDAKTGAFGLTSTDGWFLYGRVGEIADCRVVHPPADTRNLCEPPSRSRGAGALYYIWNPSSPANRRFDRGIYTPGSSPVLKRFALAVIGARPLEYARLVARDTLRYFEPGAGSFGRSDAAIELPTRPRTVPPWMNVAIRDRYFASFQPRVHAGAGLARAYTDVARIPRPLLGLMLLLALALVPLALASRDGSRPRHLPLALALALSGLGMLVGTAATSGFIVRYLVPAVPLIVAAGALAFDDVRRWLAARELIGARAARSQAASVRC